MSCKGGIEPLLRVDELLELGRLSTGVVGIGGSKNLVAGVSTRLADLGARIQLLGFEDPRSLIGDLKDGKMTAAVRGSLSSSVVVNGLREAFALDGVKRAALLEDSEGKAFLLAPVGIDEGMDYNSRLAIARSTIGYFSDLDWVLRIGVLSKGRMEDSQRGSDIKSSIDDGERMAHELAKDGHDARHYSILIEDAVRERDLIIAPDGVSGNLIFRTLHFLGGCKAYGAPVINLPRVVFVDTSRAKADFTDSVLFAAGLDVARRRSL